MSALAKDPYARAALVTMACALAAASGRVDMGGLCSIENEGLQFSLMTCQITPNQSKSSNVYLSNMR